MKTPQPILRLLTLGVVSAAALLAALTGTVHAQTTWTANTSQNWSAATWSDGVPTASSSIVLSNSVTATLTVNTAAVGASLNFANLNTTNTTLAFNGAVSLNLGSGDITDTGAGNADLSFTNATTSTPFLTADEVAIRVIEVRNTSSTFQTLMSVNGINMSGEFRMVGQTGTGSFLTFGGNITNGSQFVVNNSGTGTSATYTQTGGTLRLTSGSSYGLTFGGDVSGSTVVQTANVFNLNGGVIEALRIGVGNANGNNNTTDRYIQNGTLNFNSGTIRPTSTTATLSFENGRAFNTYNGSGTKDMSLNTSAPLLLRLASTGTHEFAPDGTSTVIISPSARVVDQTSGGTILKTGTGTLILAGGNTANANTWSGATTVNAGTMAVDYNRIAGQAATGGTDSLADAYSAASQLVLNGGAFTLTGRGSASASSAGSVALNTNTFTVNVGSTAGLVIGQPVSNANLPSGTYIRRIIDGANVELSSMSTSTANQTGQTLNFGAGVFANTQVINDVVLQAASSTVTVNPGSGSSTTLLTFSNFSGTGSLNKAGTGTLALAPGVGVTNILTGNLTGSAGTIAKSGAGRVILGTTNSDGNTFSGAIVVNEGTLQIGNATVANTSAQRLTAASSATVASGATLLYKNSSALPTGAAITLAGLLTADVTGVSGGGFYNVVGALTLSNGGELRANQGGNASNFQAFALNGTVTVSGTSASSITTASTPAGGDGIHLANNATANRTFNVADVTGNTNADLTVSARLINASSGLQAAGITKEGAGLMRLSGSNSYTGSTIVNAGTLELATTAGAAAGGTTSVTVGSTATLLISQSNQVKDEATITLSGGTIQRGSGVSETLGALTLGASSSIDFGSGSTGTLAFQPGLAGGFTPGVNTLTVLNFLPGNILSFGSSSALFAPGTYAGGFTGSGFDFGTQGFTASFASSTFTITAIPEPSTVLAALGLLGLGLWPMARRRIFGERGSRKA
jgi:fibronectin-binding autotransporter adhesin